MARYDAPWGRPARGRFYDMPYGYPPVQRGGPEGMGSRAGMRQRYAGDFAPGLAWSQGPPEGGAIYGPGRYGLGPYHERLRRRRRSDEELAEEVEEALFYDTWVDADAITVQVEDGIVTLQGQLPSYEEIRYATDDAWDVDGVLGVRSELTVRES